MKFVFMGTTSFGIPCIDALLAKGHQLVGIVSTPAREKGRGQKIIDSEIVQFAREKGLGPIFTPQSLKEEQFLANLKSLQADIFVVVAFRILPKEVFILPRKGTFNIHASLLPLYRGPAPIQRAIAAGESQTGITIFRIDTGIDTGNVLLQTKVSISIDDTTPQLSARLARTGAEGMVTAFAMLQNDRVEYAIQDNSLASNAPKLVKTEGLVDWGKTAEQIYNAIRAFKPFPGTYTFWDGLRLSVEWGTAIADTGHDAQPGTIVGLAASGIDVQCNKSILRITKVKPDGKNVMDGSAFARGRNLKIGMRFS